MYDDERERLEELVKQGDTDAMRRLGYMYLEGTGVSQDLRKAKELFEEASNLGNANAMCFLGDMYENGDGCVQDYAKAKEFYEQAAKKGNKNAIEKLDRITQKIEEAQKSKKSNNDEIIKYEYNTNINKPKNNVTSQSKVNEEVEKLKLLVSALSNKYVSREQTVRMLANNIYHGRRVIKEIKDNKTIRDNISTILLISSTGGGKTAIISDLAKEFDVPFTSVSLSAGYTQTGYVGLSLQDIFKKLINVANGDVEKAEEGIIILDEFDKIRTKEDSHDKEFKRALQQELLSYLEGREVQLDTKGGPTTFNTSKLTFILAGAFQDITEYDMDYSEEEIKELISKGYESELLGRIGIYHYMPKYTKEDYISILNNSKISPLSNFIVSCSIHGKNVITSPYSPFIESVAEEAVKLDKGVRGLNNIFANILNWYLDDLIYGENDIELLEPYGTIKKKKGRGK